MCKSQCVKSSMKFAFKIAIASEHIACMIVVFQLTLQSKAPHLIQVVLAMYIDDVSITCSANNPMYAIFTHMAAQLALMLPVYGIYNANNYFYCMDHK